MPAVHFFQPFAYFQNTSLKKHCKSQSHRSMVGVWVAQLCPTLCDPMDCSPPGSSVNGILQARILEWTAMPFSIWAPVPGLNRCSPTNYFSNKGRACPRPRGSLHGTAAYIFMPFALTPFPCFKRKRSSPIFLKADLSKGPVTLYIRYASNFHCKGLLPGFSLFSFPVHLTALPFCLIQIQLILFLLVPLHHTEIKLNGTTAEISILNKDVWSL